MPTANITNPSSGSPNIDNTGTYTVTWTVSGGIGFGATWLLAISPSLGAPSFTTISTNLAGPSISLAWTTTAAGSSRVVVGLDEVASGPYIMRLTYVYRGRNYILDTQTFTMQRSFIPTIAEAVIDVNDAIASNKGKGFSPSPVLSNIIKFFDTTAYKRGKKKTRLDTLDVNEVFSIIRGKKKTTLDTLDINDSLVFGSTAGVAQILDTFKVQDNFTNIIGRGRVKSHIDEIVVSELLNKTAHRTTVQKTLSVNYLVIKDSVSKKVLRYSHEGNTDFPMSNMIERFVVNDFILFDFASDTKQRVSDQIFLNDELRVIFITANSSLVYHINYDAFTRFSAMDAKGFSLFKKGDSEENINLLVTNSNKILKFPGDNITDKDGFIETKRLYLERGVAQRMRLDYEGSLDFIETSTLPVEGDESNQKNYSSNTVQPEKWKEISQSAGRIRSVAFMIFNADIIKKFLFIFKQRIRK